MTKTAEKPYPLGLHIATVTPLNNEPRYKENPVITNNV